MKSCKKLVRIWTLSVCLHGRPRWVSSSQLAGCVQLFGPPLEARRFEYRMELDERSGQQRRSERAERREHREHREAMQHIADIQEHINLFQVEEKYQNNGIPVGREEGRG